MKELVDSRMNEPPLRQSKTMEKDVPVVTQREMRQEKRNQLRERANNCAGRRLAEATKAKKDNRRRALLQTLGKGLVYIKKT